MHKHWLSNHQSGMVKIFLSVGKFLTKQISPQFCSRNGIFDKSNDFLLYFEEVVKYLKVMTFFLPYEVKFQNAFQS